MVCRTWLLDIAWGYRCDICIGSGALRRVRPMKEPPDKCYEQGACTIDFL